MPEETEPKRFYYYANERGCMKSRDAMDEIGVGVNDGPNSCYLSIHLIRLGDHFSMEASAHNDEWRLFTECRDVLDLLSTQVIRPGEMRDTKPFYALREHLERLGYVNLGMR